MPAARLILDPPAAGAWNMAVDDMLLARAERTGEPTLRFYTWREPTLSLGYFQHHADRTQHSASATAPLVRRASGGGAILHDRELTYSFSLPEKDAVVGGSSALYEAFHCTLVALLQERRIPAALWRATSDLAGRISESNPDKSRPFLCFQHHTPGDVVIGDDKVTGSAQRRQRGAILQHGSILLARSRSAPELPGIAELAEEELSAAELIDAWLGPLATRLGVDWRSAEHAPGERDEAARIVAARYGNDAWTLKR